MRLIERKHRLLFIGMFLMVIICMLLFSGLQIHVLNQAGAQEALIILDEEALRQGADTGIMTIDTTKIMTTAEIRQQFMQDLYSIVFIGSFVFCVIIGSLFALAGLLNSRWRRSALETAFTEICDANEKVDGKTPTPEKKRIYDSLKQHFEDRLDSYKRLSSYLSHEQKNELALLRTRLEYDKHNEYLKYVDNLTSHIDDILTLSDYTTGMDQQPVDCILLTARLCDEYRHLGIALNFDFDEDQDCMIIAKEMWIERAIHNIIENAVKYGQGQPISVFVQRQYNSIIEILNLLLFLTYQRIAEYSHRNLSPKLHVLFR